MRFDGQRILISGAASGFGRLAAERFGMEGARLALTDRDEAGLAEVVAETAAEWSAVVDVASEDDQRACMAAVADAMGGIDIALNNAGVFQPLMRIEDTSLEEYERMMTVNARGVFLALKYQLPMMAAAGGGAIVNTASVAGIVGSGMCAAYVAAKHAVVGLTKSAADEYSRHGVRVNAVCPAFARTPMLDAVTEPMGERRGESAEDVERRMTGRIPMARFGTADEVVAVMMMLSDPANSYMTGQAIAVDGGLSAI